MDSLDNPVLSHTIPVHSGGDPTPKYTRCSALQLSTYTSHLRPHHTHEHITPNDIHTPHLHAQEPLNIHTLKAHIKTSLMNSLTHYTPQQTPPVNSHWHGTSKGKYTPNTHIHMSFNRHIHTYAHCTHIHTHHSTTTNPGRNHTSNTPTSRSHPHSHIIIRQERATYKRAHTNTAQTHALCPRANQIHCTPSTRAKTCAAHTHPTPSHTLNAHTDAPHPRARTHAYMHTYIHTQPAPPSLRAEEKGARRGGGEGRRGDGPERRCRHRRSFPFDLSCCPLNAPVPHSQAKRVELGPGRVQSQPPENWKVGGNPPAGGEREGSAGTLLRSTIDPPGGSSSGTLPRTPTPLDLCPSSGCFFLPSLREWTTVKSGGLYWFQEVRSLDLQRSFLRNLP